MNIQQMMEKLAKDLEEKDGCWLYTLHQTNF